MKKVLLSFKFWILHLLVANLNAICPKTSIPGSTDGSCYFGIKTNYTFAEADDFCAEYFDGHSASIHNAFDNGNILQLVRGLSPNAEAFWLGGTYDGSQISWLDGSPNNYQNFQPDTQPGNIVLNLSTGKWSTSSWNAQLSFICGAKQAADPPCPTEWFYAESTKSCYRPIYNVDFMNAEENCRGMNSTVASVHSEDENRIIIEIIKTGRTLHTMEDLALLGAKRTGPGDSDFAWLDGTPWNYTKWGRNFLGKEPCVLLHTDLYDNPTPVDDYLYKWRTYVCESTYRIALCKKASKY